MKLQLDYAGGYRKYFVHDPTAQKPVAAFRRIRAKPGYLANPVTRDLQHAQQPADLYWKTGFRGACLYGTLTFPGKPAFGFLAASGTPLAGFGRNVYIDTYDSAYGPGWRRENSGLTHEGTGVFCYSVNPHGLFPAGKGSRYRVTVIGPGVTPDVTWEGAAPGPDSAPEDARANAAIAARDDTLCRPN